MSRHVQFESGVSLTGSNADTRVAIAPSQQRLVALALLSRIAAKHDPADVPHVPEPAAYTGALDAAADDLWRDRGESLVVCGSHDRDTQVIVHAINALLDNVGRTIDLDNPSWQRQGDDLAVAQLVDDMRRGDVDVLMLYGVNPAYDYPQAERFVAAMANVSLTISFADRLDETAGRAQAVCPDHHFLEAWGDAEPVSSFHSLAQPTIAPLFDTRAAQDSLLQWLGRTPDFYEYLRGFWRSISVPETGSLRDLRRLLGPQPARRCPDAAWAQGVSKGIRGNWRQSRRRHALATSRGRRRRFAPTAYELHLYETVGLRDGTHANNPWLQELPDPVTKITWGNYAAIAPRLAARLAIASGDIVALEAQGLRLEIPVHVQPGQCPNTISVAVGYGRMRSGKVGRGVGVNAYPLVTSVDGMRRYGRAAVRLTRTGRFEPLATTQTHHSMEGREIVREAALGTFRDSVSPHAALHEELPSLWADRPAGEHHWGMAIDLNACTGCSACVTACQAENNVPVVGKDEVRRGREMHWIRIDRYYQGSEDHTGYGRAADDVPALRQRAVRDRCVRCWRRCTARTASTSRSTTAASARATARTTVRTRSALQLVRIRAQRPVRFQHEQPARHDGAQPRRRRAVARRHGEVQLVRAADPGRQARGANVTDGRHRDGDIKTACQQVCPAEAIVFGDLRDPNSRVAQLSAGRRRYRVLEEIGTRPNVSYLTKVRNRAEV